MGLLGVLLVSGGGGPGMLPETLPALQRVLQASVMEAGLSSPGPGDCLRSAGDGGQGRGAAW